MNWQEQISIRASMPRNNPNEEIEGVYVISVAARILQMHPQTLRKYERAGLIRPSRTVGMLRLYSEDDIIRLRLIKHLVGELGLNIAGVQLALEVFNKTLYLRRQSERLDGEQLKNFVDKSTEEIIRLLYN
jgi:MerR family transcriptional regulator/heat shock protein HspR